MEGRTEIAEEKTLYIPPQINVTKLTTNGTTRTDEELAKIISSLVDQPPAYYQSLGVIKKSPTFFYYLEEMVGHGTFAQTHLLSSFQVPIQPTFSYKVVKMEYVRTDADENCVAAEQEVLNCLHLYNDLTYSSGRSYSALIMDYVPGDNLRNLIAARNNKTSPFTWTVALCFNLAEQAVQAFIDLNANGVFHADIKPANIMFDIVSQKLTVVDFGIAFPLRPKQEANFIFDYPAGTPDYMAPELKREADTFCYTEKNQVYSLGVVLQEIFLAQITDDVESKESLEKLIAGMKAYFPGDRPGLRKALQELKVIGEQYAKKHAEEVAQTQRIYQQAVRTDQERLKKTWEGLRNNSVFNKTARVAANQVSAVQEAATRKFP